MKKIKATDRRHLKDLILDALSNNITDLNFIDTSEVTEMTCMFINMDMNFDISTWDVSNVTRMTGMFEKSTFNNDISAWDVSKVTDMQYMFRESSFNQNISEWDVSKVEIMEFMFAYSIFNQDLSKWDVSSVNTMRGMFQGSAFNQNINDWVPCNVKEMHQMFGDSPFNQDLSKWDVSSVKNMFGIFSNSAFNQDISSWNLHDKATFYRVFDGIEDFDLKNVPTMLYTRFGASLDPLEIDPSLADLIHTLELTNIEIALSMAYAIDKLEETIQYTYKYLIDASVLGKPNSIKSSLIKSHIKRFCLTL